MVATMQFQKNAHVLAANDREVGELERVVVKPATNEVTHIVVRHGSLFKKKDKVVPIGLVAEATKDQVVLKAETGDPESLPPFEEARIVDERGRAGRASSNVPPHVLPGYSGGALFPPDPNDLIVTERVRNIPEGTVAMKEGAKVVAAEGERVGQVERVLAEPSEDRITHLLISSGLAAKARKLIPIRWVDSIDEDLVRLRVKKVSVDELTNASAAA
ncbi:MAG: PRC-barrel domain-containing protein [Chloroflexota bacterium]